ncbi:hypothetical protein WH243_14650 [Acinetobacter sp. MYb177]|uniref:hypothetical protein n=1 Tax=unclassified Acinetobacter TaxID=196816 RepID=UPI0030AB0674
MFFSLWIELFFKVENFFSASGTLFTVSGLLLSIKLSAIFHLYQMSNGKKIPLNITSKYILGTGTGGVFASSDNDDVKRTKVEEIEKDEVYGIYFMIFGTILWGYGSYLIQFLNTYFA